MNDIVIDKSACSDFGFTDRQIDVLECIARGITTREAIATELKISEETLKRHIHGANGSGSEAYRLGLKGYIYEKIQEKGWKDLGAEQEGWLTFLLRLHLASMRRD